MDGSPPGHYPETVVACRLTRDRAIKSLRNWWGGISMAYSLNRQASITECALKYVPFWKVRAHAMGYVDKPAYASEYVDHVTVHIDKKYVWTGIACDPQGIGVAYLRNVAGESEPYDPDAGAMLEPTVPEESAMAEGLSAIEAAAIGNAGGTNIAANQAKITPLARELLFYPLWRVKYAYSDEAYWATIDGVTGELLAGRAPADRRLQKAAVVASLIAFVGAMALSVWVSLYASGYICPAVILTIACLAIALIALSFYEAGPTIAVGELVGRYRQASGWGKFLYGTAGPVREDREPGQNNGKDIKIVKSDPE